MHGAFIRPAATQQDKLTVLAVAHAANASEYPLAVYQARRLHHHRRSRATWWLLEEDGEAASAMVCHPLRLSVDGEIRAGFGVGAVVTRPERRKRGHASALCARVADECAAEGRTIGLLFSAIPPAFYERLGYSTLPAWDLRCEDPAGLAASGPPARLRALDPRQEAAGLLSLYRRYHEERYPALHADRDAAAWERTLVENSDDLFFGWGDPLRGYVRIYDDDGNGLELVELVSTDAGDEAAALRWVAELTASFGRAAFHGWLPPSAATEGWFQDIGRAHTLPMVRGLDPPPDARFWASDYF